MNNKELTKKSPDKKEEDYWCQAVRLASRDEQRNKEIAAWDKIASKVKDK